MIVRTVYTYEFYYIIIHIYSLRLLHNAYVGCTYAYLMTTHMVTYALHTVFIMHLGMLHNIICNTLRGRIKGKFCATNLMLQFSTHVECSNELSAHLAV